MKRYLLAILLFLVLAAAGWGAVFAWKNLRGIKPAIEPPPQDITQELPPHASSDGSAAVPPASNATSLPLQLPDGFAISVFAKNVPDARVITFDQSGSLWVSQPKEGKVSKIDAATGAARAVFTGLNNPHGLAFDPQNSGRLYIAEENRISYADAGSGGRPIKIADLPAGGEHTTRTIGFGPDGRLYVSIGSTCNACNERDPMRAAIYSMNKDGSDLQQVAGGLRNSVFFAWDKNGAMWATDMGRDYLGDNVPPDEINILSSPSTSSGQNPVPDFGWPICYGQNIHDTNFDKNTYIQSPCNGKIPPAVEIPAHSAPLGLAFAPSDGSWPEDYRNSIIVAYHGSWNRSAPTGYKLVSITLDAGGKYEGTRDFVTGWLNAKNQALGRPVDVIVGSDNALYVSDDKAGAIYRISYYSPH